MPIAQLIRNNVARIAEMQARLTAEWTAVNEASPPGSSPVLIVDEQPVRFGVPYAPVHLYAIWDEWADLSPRERSEILMDSYTATHPSDNVLRVTLAMGLTVAEAHKMGLKYKT